MATPLTGRNLLFFTLALCYIVALEGKDFYELLRIPRGANEQQIRRAYRKLAVQFHPDKVQGTEEEKARAEKEFADINNAYETLSNTEKRNIYDRFGEEGLRQHQGQQQGGGGGGRNIFDFFFGGGFGGGEEDGEDRVQKGHDMYVDLQVTLNDVFVGKEFKMLRDKSVIQPAPGTRECKCRQKLVTRQLGPGMFQQYTQNVCEECPNVSLGREQGTINVHVDAGMSEGQQIEYFEEGEPMVDGEPGDLKIVVRILPHGELRRDGHNLYLRQTITLVDALTGFSKQFTHLDDHQVTLSSEEVTRPGKVQEIPNEGMPIYGQEHRRGNLFVEYTVDFPSSLTEKQKQTIRELFK